MNLRQIVKAQGFVAAIMFNPDLLKKRFGSGLKCKCNRSSENFKFSVLTSAWCQD